MDYAKVSQCISELGPLYTSLGAIFRTLEGGQLVLAPGVVVPLSESETTNLLEQAGTQWAAAKTLLAQIEVEVGG